MFLKQNRKPVVLQQQILFCKRNRHVAESGLNAGLSRQKSTQNHYLADKRQGKQKEQ